MEIKPSTGLQGVIKLSICAFVSFNAKRKIRVHMCVSVLLKEDGYKSRDGHLYYKVIKHSPSSAYTISHEVAHSFGNLPKQPVSFYLVLVISLQKLVCMISLQ